jgi:hypothetical protein
VTEVLRPGVLTGVRFAVAPSGVLGEAVAARLEALGAARDDLTPPPDDLGPPREDLGPPPPDDLAAPPADDLAAPRMLVVDGAALFSAAAGAAAVRAALDGAWDAIQPLATRPMLILLLAPSPGDAHNEAARAGLENLARTLSIEWARLGIRPVAIHPGAETPADEVAELAAFLASPAGAYYSGCRFDLR